jgi:tungstate transport system substrate-binding protein
MIYQLKRVLIVLLTVGILLIACIDSTPRVLRLATTTSTYDSGLLDYLLPLFKTESGIRVDVISVGTGQALALGERGDVDVVMVHNEKLEDAFVTAGYGLERYQVMYNDFIIAGPEDDPAGVAGLCSAVEALIKIASAEATFASRGDDSGTHARELEFWSQAGIQPSSDSTWYLSLGQGMAQTLFFANERGAYALTDRGTFLSNQDNLSRLGIMIGGESIDENCDPLLLNVYGVIPVNPSKFPEVKVELAMVFIEWLTSIEKQGRIAAFGLERFGQPLFYPASFEWQAANP